MQDEGRPLTSCGKRRMRRAHSTPHPILTITAAACERHQLCRRIALQKATTERIRKSRGSPNEGRGGTRPAYECVPCEPNGAPWLVHRHPRAARSRRMRRSQLSLPRSVGSCFSQALLRRRAVAHAAASSSAPAHVQRRRWAGAGPEQTAACRDDEGNENGLVL